MGNIKSFLKRQSDAIIIRPQINTLLHKGIMNSQLLCAIFFSALMPLHTYTAAEYIGCNNPLFWQRLTSYTQDPSATGPEAARRALQDIARTLLPRYDNCYHDECVITHVVPVLEKALSHGACMPELGDKSLEVDLFAIVIEHKPNTEEERERYDALAQKICGSISTDAICESDDRSAAHHAIHHNKHECIKILGQRGALEAGMGALKYALINLSSPESIHTLLLAGARILPEHLDSGQWGFHNLYFMKEKRRAIIRAFYAQQKQQRYYQVIQTLLSIGSRNPHIIPLRSKPLLEILAHTAACAEYNADYKRSLPMLQHAQPILQHAQNIIPIINHKKS